jgi:hypothetical protein
MDRCTEKTESRRAQRADLRDGKAGRSQTDAPEIDGAAYLRNTPVDLTLGMIIETTIADADAQDRTVGFRCFRLILSSRADGIDD